MRARPGGKFFHFVLAALRPIYPDFGEDGVAGDIQGIIADMKECPERYSLAYLRLGKK
jgi:hypothetical protein